MKSKGIRTKLRGIMTCPGVWPGIEANIIPKAEKARDDNAKHAIMAPMLTIWEPKRAMPTRTGIIETPAP
jgi:hypothetical protein